AVSVSRSAWSPEEGGLLPFALRLPGGKVDLAGLTLESLPLPRQSAQFDLTLAAAEVGRREGGLALCLEFADLFDETTARRLLSHLRTLLAAVAAAPETRLSELPLLGEGDRWQLLGEVSDTALAVPGERCLHETFHTPARRAPAGGATRRWRG